MVHLVMQDLSPSKNELDTVRANVLTKFNDRRVHGLSTYEGLYVYLDRTKQKQSGLSEDWIKGFFRLSSWITIAITFCIIASLAYETIKFFTYVSPNDFFFNTIGSTDSL